MWRKWICDNPSHIHLLQFHSLKSIHLITASAITVITTVGANTYVKDCAFPTFSVWFIHLLNPHIWSGLPLFVLCLPNRLALCPFQDSRFGLLKRKLLRNYCCYYSCFSSIFNMATKYIKLCFWNIYKAPLTIYSALYVPLILYRNFQNQLLICRYPPIPPPQYKGMQVAIYSGYIRVYR